MPESIQRGPADAVTLDRVARALSSRQRRRILFAFLERPRWELHALVEIAADGATREERVQVVHKNVPHLVAAGFLEEGERAGVYTRGDQFEVIRSYLEVLRDNEHRIPHELP